MKIEWKGIELFFEEMSKLRESATCGSSDPGLSACYIYSINILNSCKYYKSFSCNFHQSIHQLPNILSLLGLCKVNQIYTSVFSRICKSTDAGHCKPGHIPGNLCAPPTKSTTTFCDLAVVKPMDLFWFQCFK